MISETSEKYCFVHLPRDFFSQTQNGNLKIGANGIHNSSQQTFYTIVKNIQLLLQSFTMNLFFCCCCNWYSSHWCPIIKNECIVDCLTCRLPCVSGPSPLHWWYRRKAQRILYLHVKQTPDLFQMSKIKNTEFFTWYLWSKHEWKLIGFVKREWQRKPLWWAFNYANHPSLGIWILKWEHWLMYWEAEPSHRS